MFTPKFSSGTIALQDLGVGTLRPPTVHDETLITEDIAEYGMSILDSFPPSRQMSEAEQGRSEAAMALPPVDRGRGAWCVEP